MAQSSTAVEFSQVAKRFGRVIALHPLDLTIAKGELVTLLGPSGCGKTTLLRLIAGLELPSEGTIRIDGRNVTGTSANQRDVSLVFQSYALFPHMSSLENVCYGLLASGMKKAQAIELALAKMELLGIADLGARLSSELSGGQQQRVAVARSLVLEPAVLMFDEPLSNLDAKLRRKVRQDIHDLQQNLNLTVVYVTHDQEEALAVSDRIVVMEQGRIVTIGSPRELYESPATRFVADFIGDANLIDGELTSASGQRVFRAENVEVTVLPPADMPDGPVALAIRPHRIRLGAVADGVLQGTLLRQAYLGSRIESLVATPLGELLVFSDALLATPEPGAAVGVYFAPGDARVTARG
ncbi:ABC transporter ATP-binding protein [Polaromonas sp. P1(28)-13]|nr:ABC transporter ATP-binding protein [Polaromonas sp. P1-6]UUZ69794.1 ABC transporter ATP-binding protein [Polaromonas sp. P2-4]UUZ77828.1 ABC transporter ATP-binding protein [Polaromonas sp. P1(28)-13]